MLMQLTVESNKFIGQVKGEGTFLKLCWMIFDLFKNPGEFLSFWTSPLKMVTSTHDAIKSFASERKMMTHCWLWPIYFTYKSQHPVNPLKTRIVLWGYNIYWPIIRLHNHGSFCNFPKTVVITNYFKNQ